MTSRTPPRPATSVLAGGCLIAACAAALPVAALPARAAAQDPAVNPARARTGTVTGRVTDRASGAPLADVQVGVAGTPLGARTGPDGRYRIAVPPGTAQLRAVRIGYAAQTRAVTVAATEAATADFVLAVAATQLDQVVVNATTGQAQRQRESGASLTTIDTTQFTPTNVPNFSTVLSSRTAGVTVQEASGTSGTSARIRIRGGASLSLSNDPLLIIDGVRVAAQTYDSTTQLLTGGQLPSRLNDLNPDEIESIDVIKGPAATGLYGTQAANGVIQVTTKRGVAGRTRLAVFGEGGGITDPNTYPRNYASFGPVAVAGGASLPLCTYARVAAGFCSRVDSTVSTSPLQNASPFRTGYRSGGGLQVSGGSTLATYFLSGELAGEQGVYDPNRVKRVSLRSNVRGQLLANLDATVNVGYVANRVGLVANDNAYGPLGLALLGGGQDCRPGAPCVNVLALLSGGGFQLDSTSRGYFPLLGGRPGTAYFNLDTHQDTDRLTGSLTSNWQPLAWLTATGTAGLDVADIDNNQVLPPNIFTAIPLYQSGFRSAGRTRFATYTANGSAQAAYAVAGALRGTTTLGGQYVNERTNAITALGRGIAPGTGLLGNTSSAFTNNEVYVPVVTVGGFLQQQFAYRDRVFVTGGLRTDRNSAFGSNLGAVVYPTGSLSWVVSDEPFFRRSAALSTFRLRGAVGQSGTRPGFRAAERYFNTSAVPVNGAEQNGLSLGGAGNPELKPERTTEAEAGFDAGLLADRLGLTFTYYSKTTSDALVNAPLAPSLGETAFRFENLGRVRNAGVEAVATLRVVDRRAVRGTITANYTRNDNKLVTLGQGQSPVIFGFSAAQRLQPGYPLGGYFAQPITGYADANGNGVIDPGEVQVGATPVYLGNPFPRSQFSLVPSVGFLNDAVRVQALLDHRGGQKLFNDTEFYRCTAVANCRGLNDKTDALADQARAVAGLQGTVAGYIEDASFTKLREVSVTFTGPRALASRFRASGVSLTLAGRNLHTWTHYTGLDPEVNAYGGGVGNFNYATVDFLSQPPVRYYTARLTVTF